MSYTEVNEIRMDGEFADWEDAEIHALSRHPLEQMSLKGSDITTPSTGRRFSGTTITIAGSKRTRRPSI